MHQEESVSDETRVADRVVTHLRLAASSAAVWQTLMFYEDVPRAPWSIFRFLLPRPLRSEGDKSRVGNVVHCFYEDGYLMKRITAVEPGELLRFEVIEQQLGIERTFRAHEGSYELRALPTGTAVTLTTRYAGSLWPRFLWRPVERYFGHKFHLYVLRGMREALDSQSRSSAEATPDARDEANTVAVPRR